MATGKTAVGGLDKPGKITDVAAMESTDLLREQLLEVARAYGAAENKDLSTVSWRALGDTKKLAAIIDGADIQSRRFLKTMQWFSDHWPDNAIWPEDIARPTARTDEAAE